MYVVNIFIDLVLSSHKKTCKLVVSIQYKSIRFNYIYFNISSKLHCQLVIKYYVIGKN